MIWPDIIDIDDFYLLTIIWIYFKTNLKTEHQERKIPCVNATKLLVCRNHSAYLLHVRTLIRPIQNKKKIRCKGQSIAQFFHLNNFFEKIYDFGFFYHQLWWESIAVSCLRYQEFPQQIKIYDKFDKTPQ